MKKVFLILTAFIAVAVSLQSCGGVEKRIAEVDSDGIDNIIKDAKFNMIDPSSFAMYELEVTDTLDNEDILSEFSDVEKVSLASKLNTKFYKVSIKYRQLNQQNGTSIGSVNGIVSANDMGAVMHGGDNKTIRYMVTGTTEKPKKKE